MSTQSNGNSLFVQGRIIWTIGNSLFEGKGKTNMQTKAPVMGQDGKQVIEYGFGLAIPKIDPKNGQNSAEYVKAFQALYAEALTLFPSGQVPPAFAMKYKDGDVDVDDKGVPYSNRETYKGHFVISCTTQIPIKYFVWENGNNQLVNSGIKCGDYVNVQLNIKAHPAVGQSKAGLYVNPSAVQLIAPGKEIVNTPSGDQIFGMTAPQYVGQIDAYQTPTLPGQMQAQQPMQAPVQQTPAYAQPGMPQQQFVQQPVMAPGPSAPQQAVPHYGVVPEQFQPQQQAPQFQAQWQQQQVPQQPMQQPMQQAPVNTGMPPMPGMPR